ncbi:MAG: hypothetical protein E6R03_14815 [Hyphomicrobiaceae bacterium]|nr:MAG: hypothetical protein E6R03_14815 [Hyphomicrobiaceae bacterium]
MNKIYVATPAAAKLTPQKVPYYTGKLSKEAIVSDIAAIVGNVIIFKTGERRLTGETEQNLRLLLREARKK